MKKALLIIDPQNDFIDNPSRMGSLAVTGAFEDMKRLAQHIDSDPPSAIVITLDSHAKMHIAHPMWWVNEKGEHPGIFTLITVEDIQAGIWKAAEPEAQEWALHYVKELEKNGKYELRIWPYHCIVGSEGHKVSDELMPALQRWEEATGSKVEYIYKGRNPYTEHYSGFKAEVIREDDIETQLNIPKLKYLASFDKIEVAGEAKSHCTASSATDLIEFLGKDANKVTLLTNCMSSVTGYEANGDAFVTTAVNAGCQAIEIPEVAAKKPKMM